MAEGHGRDRWARASLLMAIIENGYRDPKKRPRQPADYSPYKSERVAGDCVVVDKENVSLFRQAFLGEKK